MIKSGIKGRLDGYVVCLDCRYMCIYKLIKSIFDCYNGNIYKGDTYTPAPQSNQFTKPTNPITKDYPSD